MAILPTGRTASPDPHRTIPPPDRVVDVQVGGAAAARTGDSRVFPGKRVHCIGIGGCGLSGLALMLQRLGARCSGSDSVGGPVLDVLREEAIPCTTDQSPAGLPDDCDLVVASAAIRPDHPQRMQAEERGVRVISYAEALGMLQSERTGISVAGTHGKSTTTAMLCHVLMMCGLDPSFIVGAHCRQIGGGSRTGAGTIPQGPLAGRPGLLAAEACEFGRSFHHHRPTMAVINNVEEDHLDVYPSLDAIIEAFRHFADLLPPASSGGRLLIADEGAHRRQITAGTAAAVETFGFSPFATYQILTDASVQRVGLLQDGVWLTQWTNRMPGVHNAMNAAAAAILAQWAGGDWEQIAAALESFEGLDRRMQRVGTKPVDGGEVVIYDDYGHHPTEIDRTLHALRAAEQPKRLICVFQPHQHSRTRFLLKEFAQSFTAADVVIVSTIYFVRDSEIERSRVSASDLVDCLRARGMQAMHLHPFEAIVEHLELITRPGDLVVVMGAGPVGRIAHDFLHASAATEEELTPQ